jgi:hypothetical protein
MTDQFGPHPTPGTPEWDEERRASEPEDADLLRDIEQAYHAEHCPGCPRCGEQADR